MPKEREKNRAVSEPEVFIVSKRNDKLLKEYSKYQSLFGSDVRYDPEGNIFYPVWHEVGRDKVSPDNYSLLSKKSRNDSSYLSLPLITKKLLEVKIHKITKDGGSIEAAIRSVDHVLESKLRKEKPQINGVRGRIDKLFDLFSDFSNITDEELLNYQKETVELLREVGLDPNKVILEEKRKMLKWLVKASGGKDVLGRKNLLITTMALEASYRRAIEFNLGMGETISKFARMREALFFEREFSREIFREVKENLKPERIPAHYLFRYPERPPQNIGVVKGMLSTMCWKLDQLHVKPYKPMAVKAQEKLNKILELLNENRRENIVNSNLFGETYELIITTLEKYKDIYPE